MPGLIDSHCHLADPAFSEDLDEVVQRARAAGVHGGLCVLALGDAAEEAQAARVRAAWPELRYAVGAHPHQAHEFAGRTGAVSEAVAAACVRIPGVCAVGEIGLDYHYDLSPREVQRDVFRRQVAFAREGGWPVVIHTREADADTVSILAEEGRGEVRGIFHCFSGTAELARAALDLGFTISLSGIVTFPKAGPLRALAAEVPADRLLVETDCPYLAPVPRRGRRNEPAWVVHTAETVAAVRGMKRAELDGAVTGNFARLFPPLR
ncbi:MAG: TatD family deoxyribonuclease [Acidobacteria bacterium]|nr:MAG: TatD family deoxyribonuclease [Acidobacteriota bacterium]